MKTQTTQPEHRYLCEAREPGKPSHEFPTPDAATARCMCDAMGWEFIRVYKPGGDSDRPATKPQAGNPALSPRQRTCLVTEANKTWRALTTAGVTSESFDSWRHDQVQACVRRPGLSACQSGHYKKLLNHFRSLRGVETPHLSQYGKQSREGGDTADRRDQLIHLIAVELGHHARRVEHPQTLQEADLAAHAKTKGGALTVEYLVAIARAKNPGQSIQESGDFIKLPASRLEHLLFTLRQRIRAREGRAKK